jgi:hypothetical protein
MNERRENHRFDTAFPVECILLPERKKIFFTVSRNMSLGGIKILLDQFLPVGKGLKLQINLANEVAEARATIAWCNKLPFADRYAAGLRFLEVNTENKEILGAFLTQITHP